MDVQRAAQISQDPIMCEVTYNGMQVYIQHVDTEQEMARIFPLESPQDEQTVPVRSLMEH